MKRATTITLLCMGVGAAFVANSYENGCDAQRNEDPQLVSALTAGAPTPTSAPKPSNTSCRSTGGYYSHAYYHNSSSSGLGFVSSGISRGGFGGSGHHSSS
jgi:hypothetical protein